MQRKSRTPIRIGSNPRSLSKRKAQKEQLQSEQLCVLLCKGDQSRPSSRSRSKLTLTKNMSQASVSQNNVSTLPRKVSHLGHVANDRSVRVNILSRSPQGKDILHSTHVKELLPVAKCICNSLYTSAKENLRREPLVQDLRRVKVLENRIAELHRDRHLLQQGANEDRYLLEVKVEALTKLLKQKEEEHSKLTQCVATLIAENQRITLQHKSISVSNDGLQSKVNELQAVMECKITQADDQCMPNVSEMEYAKIFAANQESREKEFEAIKKENQLVRRENSNLQEMNKHLEREKSTIQEEYTEIANQLEGEISKNLSLFEQIESLKGQIKTLLEENEETKQKLVEKGDYLFGRQVKICQLEAAIENMTRQMNLNDEERDKNNGVIQKQLNNVQERHQEIVLASKEKISMLQQELKAMEIKNEELLSIVQKMKIEKDILEHAIQKIQSKSDVIEEQSSYRRNDTEQSQIYVRQQCHFNINAQKICSDFEQNFKDTIRSKNLQNERLNEEIIHLRQKCKKMDEQIKRFQFAIEKFQEQQMQSQKHLHQKEIILSKKQIECQQLNEKYNELQQKHQVLNQSKLNMSASQVLRKDCRTCEQLLKTVSRLNGYLSPHKQ